MKLHKKSRGFSISIHDANRAKLSKYSKHELSYIWAKLLTISIKTLLTKENIEMLKNFFMLSFIVFGVLPLLHFLNARNIKKKNIEL
jgi:hypothetical protein